jgi:predicted dehydrogenase
MDRCVAVLGTGAMGMRHLAILNRTNGVRTVAVPKRPERAGELAKQGYETAGNLAEAQAKGAALCVISTDTGQHLEDGLAAIDAGLDVLLEKPMATNACDAQLLRDRARENNRRIYIACVLRFSESLNTFRNLLPKVGNLHSVRIESQSYMPDWRPDRPYLDTFRARAGEGGVLLDLIHEIDYAGWLYGWPTSLRGSVKNLGVLGIAADEIAEMNWDTPDGNAVSIAVDFLTRPPRRRMSAYGERGTIEWNGTTGTVILQLAGDQVTKSKSLQTSEQMLTAQTHAFLDAAAGKEDSRLATADDGIGALMVCDAARRSSESGKEVRVGHP